MISGLRKGFSLLPLHVERGKTPTQFRNQLSVRGIQLDETERLGIASDSRQRDSFFSVRILSAFCLRFSVSFVMTLI